MGGKRLTQEDVIKRFREAHGDKYDYSKVVFKKAKEKVLIICQTHGGFWQTPQHHYKGVGCPHCGAIRGGDYIRKTTEKFIEESKETHGDKYDYSKVSYINSSTKVCIICPEHGEFWQMPMHHIGGRGCGKCGGTGKKSNDEFITQAKQVHGDKYSYEKTNYINDATKVIITCKEHGDFEQRPNSHLRGKGCCACGNYYKYTTEDFINLANAVHNNRYLYDKTTYVSSHQKVIITCKKHGYFLQRPYQHLQGAGCPNCKRSYGEERIANYLSKNNIAYKEQSRLKNESLLCKNRVLVVDFYLQKYNTIIEYNGVQHYNEIRFFKKFRLFEQQQERDNALRQYCKEHKIKLIEIPYWDFDNIENILKKELKIKT